MSVLLLWKFLVASTVLLSGLEVSVPFHIFLMYQASVVLLLMMVMTLLLFFLSLCGFVLAGLLDA